MMWNAFASPSLRYVGSRFYIEKGLGHESIPVVVYDHHDGEHWGFLPLASYGLPDFIFSDRRFLTAST